jgi:uncharacterized membrane protein
MHIRNPVEWSLDFLKSTGSVVDTVSHAGRYAEREVSPPIRRIDLADLGDALARGLADFAAYRTDIIFLCAIYPIVGLILARLAFGYDMLPLLFPLASGFALVGPFAAVGLYEISRQREQGGSVTWSDAFAVLHSPSLGAIVVLGLLLMAIFLMWLSAAMAIYTLTLGPEPPVSIAAFAQAVFMTDAGWALIILGVGIGFLFAVLVLAISVVSFPLLLDREVGLRTAVATSVRSVLANPGPMAIWGLIVTAGLVVGSIPFFLGLIIVMPVLGHATWHLYRKVISRASEDVRHRQYLWSSESAASRDGDDDRVTFLLARDHWPRVFPGL